MAFMRHNNNGRRHNNNRHRHSSQGGSQQGQRRHVNRINQVFESNGPDGRVRGTAQQIVEKYMSLARDAQVSGDKVLSMNHLQHAEHYQRLLNEITEENAGFEREREAQRAAQQAQPDISGEDGSEGFVDNAAGDDQPREQREQRSERRFDNRGPRPQRAPRSRTEDDADDSDNSLPNFLQVPIKDGSPEAEGDAPAKAPKPRIPRPRRAAGVEE